MLRSLRNDFLQLRRALHPLRDDFRASPCFFLFFGTRWCMLRFYIFLGDFALVELDKKGKITNYGPIKNLSPPLERKKVP
jgi:hypothetical protein